MNIEIIWEARRLGKLSCPNQEICQILNLNPGQVYAINILSLRKGISPELLEDKLDLIKQGMTIGQIAEVLGLKKEDSL